MSKNSVTASASLVGELDALGKLAHDLLAIYEPEGEMTVTDWQELKDSAFELSRNVESVLARTKERVKA